MFDWISFEDELRPPEYEQVVLAKLHEGRIIWLVSAMLIEGQWEMDYTDGPMYAFIGYHKPTHWAYLKQ